MKGKVTRTKRVVRSVKVSAKQKMRKKAFEIPEDVEVIVERDKEESEEKIFEDFSVRSTPLVTPLKGFRPFDTETPISLDNTPFDGQRETERRLLESHGDELAKEKRFRRKRGSSDPPDLWSKGIENVMYSPNEFTFKSFPIYY